MRSSCTFRMLLVLAMAALAAVAQAGTVHCAKTPAGLLSSLAVAEGDDDVEVRVVAGTYPMPASFAFDHGGSIRARISGGWDASCIHQTHDTSLTILQPDPAATAIGASFIALKGDLEIDTLTFQDMRNGVVVTLGDQDGWAPTHRGRVRNCAFLRDGSVRLERKDGPGCGSQMDIQFFNNLVADSQDAVAASRITACDHDSV